MNLGLLDILTAGTPGQKQGVPLTEIQKPSNNTAFRGFSQVGTPGTSGTPQNTKNILKPDLSGLLVKACLDLDLKPQQLWRFLSLDDISDIQSGLIDPSMLRVYAERWNDHPYLVPIGNDLPCPTITKPPDPELIICNTCCYFKPNKMGNGIGDCSKGLKGSDGKPLFPNAKRHCASYDKLTM